MNDLSAISQADTENSDANKINNDSSRKTDDTNESRTVTQSHEAKDINGNKTTAANQDKTNEQITTNNADE